MKKSAQENKKGNVMSKALDNFESMKLKPSDNPIYEDPQDVIDKQAKRCGSEFYNSKKERDVRWQIKKKKLAKKYEGLIVGLMERCEETCMELRETHSYNEKLKEKLKLVLAYNSRFSIENDDLQTQIAQYQRVVVEMESRVKEVLEKEVPEEVRIVEVCMSCNTSEIVGRQLQNDNDALRKDMTAMKDIIYRLNMRLSSYQDKLKNKALSEHLPESEENLLKTYSQKCEEKEESGDIIQPQPNGTKSSQGNDCLPPYSVPNKSTRSQEDIPEQINASALAPLFQSYQDSINEKDSLILDYEKQFANFNQKMRKIIQEKRELSEKLSSCCDDLRNMRERLKICASEKECMEIDRIALGERTEKAEKKLKEVYELYEEKVAAMSRDYQTLHAEYFSVRTTLSQYAAQLQRANAESGRTVPDFERLFEELRRQYNDDRARTVSELEGHKRRADHAEEKLKRLESDLEKTKNDLKTALKRVRQYRRAAVVFRSRLRASVASLNSLRRSRRRSRPIPQPQPRSTMDEQTVMAAVHKVDSIRAEIQKVKSRAYQELEEVERRMNNQRDLHDRETQRLLLLLEHKEDIIRKLIERVAAGEATSLRPSEPINHLNIGTQTHDPSIERRGGARSSVRLVPAPGGYFQQSDTRRITGGRS